MHRRREPEAGRNLRSPRGEWTKMNCAAIVGRNSTRQIKRKNPEDTTRGQTSGRRGRETARARRVRAAGSHGRRHAARRREPEEPPAGEAGAGGRGGAEDGRDDPSGAATRSPCRVRWRLRGRVKASTLTKPGTFSTCSSLCHLRPPTKPLKNLQIRLNVSVKRFPLSNALSLPVIDPH